MFILLHFKPFNRPLSFYLLTISSSAPSSPATAQICTAVSLFTCPFFPPSLFLLYFIPTKKISADVTVFTLDLFQYGHSYILERKNKIKLQFCTSSTVMGCFLVAIRQIHLLALPAQITSGFRSPLQPTLCYHSL